MEMSIQELLPTTAIAEAGKSEADGGNTRAVSGGVFAEILQEFAAGHVLESEPSTGESVPSDEVEKDVPIKELRLVSSPEDGVPEDSKDEEHPTIPVPSETGRTDEHLHDVPLLQSSPPEHTASGEVSHVAKLVGHVFNVGTKSAGKVGSPPSGVPANTQAVERVNEVVHAPGARAHNPLIHATADPADPPETVAPEITAAAPKVHVNGETVVPETVSETREPVHKVVAEAVRERPLLSKNEEAARVETPPRIRQETVNPRPVPGPALVSVEEGLSRLEKGMAALAQTSRRTAHPVFGAMNVNEWHQFHLRHAEMH
ncbi:MAG: hypothetical protein IIB38_00130, partial [Candidatus Hydrogenedentes bacterium]|nr:hypothetical protein [Candidatus Hydrogenedentota bacterium]